jgi:hypothetical protein
LHGICSADAVFRKDRFMRFALLAACAAVASLSAGAQNAPPPAVPPAVSAGAELPAYVVVEGQFPRDELGQQALTVVCPGNHVVLGAGYTALVRWPAKAGKRRGELREGGVSNVRSLPDMNGRAWRVEAQSRDAQTLKTGWRLVVRVVCMAPLR